MGLNGFDPGWWLRNADLQTIAASLLPARPPPCFEAIESFEVPVAIGSSVRLLVHRPDGPPRGVALILHGLGGSAESPTAVRCAMEAVGRGWIAVRMNYRNCGGTAHLTTTFYNAGMSGDLAAVLAELRVREPGRPIVVLGWSMGGTLLLKYLGEAAARATPAPQAPFPGPVEGPGRAGRVLRHLGKGTRCAAAVALSPAIDLEAGMLWLERPRNMIYNFAFVHSLLAVARERHRLGVTPPRASAELRSTGPPEVPSFLNTPTLRAFDETYTAPDAGYDNATTYYRGVSPTALLERIDVPTLIFASRDDPVIPVDQADSLPRHRGSVHVRITDRGGHCGWMLRGAAPQEGPGRPERLDLSRWTSWVTVAAMDFLEQITP